jgi:hypothetical protein
MLKMNKLHYRNALAVFAIFSLSFVPRLLLVIFHLEIASDAVTYGNVASNILLNGCVSLVNPAEGLCTPHWGGNQFPGFPAFIALIWAFVPESWIAVAVAQSLVFSLSVVYLWYALDKCLISPVAAILATLVVSLSPLSMPWARFILTDTLSLTVVVIVAAELLRSLDEGKLRIPTIGIALGIGFFIRFDTAILAIPVAIIGFYLHSFQIAIRRGLAIAFILLAPVLAWSARGISVGLGPYPNIFFISNGYSPPMGYIAWARTWATSQYQAPMWFYPIHFAEYSKINLPPDAFQSEAQKSRVLDVLVALESFNGTEFPKELDNRFQQFADENKAGHPMDYWLTLPLKRLALIWINPLNSAGWPVRTGWLNGIPHPKNLFEIIIANPYSAVVKGVSAMYRIGLPLIAFAFLVFRRNRISPIAKIFLIATLGHTLFRTIFLGWGFFIETRYLLQLVPFLEIALALCVIEILQVKKKLDPPDKLNSINNA